MSWNVAPRHWVIVILRHCRGVIFRGKISRFMYLSTLEDKSRCLETSGTNHLTRHHNPEERRPPLQSCESPKTGNK